MSKPNDTSKPLRDASVVEPITQVADLDGRLEESGEAATSSKEIPLRTVGIRAAAASVTDEPDSAITRSSQANSADDPYLGCVVDERYRIEQVIGEGGMGVVYLCKHKVIGKRVAMKVLRADLARDQEVTRRFLNEARAASAIGNPHIIDISDFGQLPDGSTYFVMEYLDGMPLTRVIDPSHPVPIERLLNIALQLAEALAAAHDAGIVHRDLKPDNIFLVSRGNEKDFVKILDFGIAKVSTAEGRLTRVGTVFGTPHYMSPEQATGTTVDYRGDVYSLGVILYEMASGRVPFDADNFMGILTQHMYKAPVPVRALVPLIQDIPAGLEAIILKCLSKRPEHRYQSMRDLADELLRAQRGITPKALPELRATGGGFNAPPNYYQQDADAAERRTRWSVSSRGRLYAGLIGVLLAAGLATVFWLERSRFSESPEAASKGVAMAPSVATGATPAPNASATPGPARQRQVTLTMKPADAHAYLDGKDLGVGQVSIQVPESTTISVEIQRADYLPTTVVLDGEEQQKSVELVRRGTHRTPSHAKQAATSQNIEITDPWKSKPKGR